MSYASGKFAIGLCDRCAFEYPLKDLKKEWTGFKVCNECFEPKHPQLEPHTAPADPQALYRPRPNTDKGVGEGYVVVVYTDIYTPHYMNSDIIGTNFTVSEIAGNLGSPTVITDGSAPSPSPSPSPSPTPSPTTYTVTVASYLGANYFYIDGARTPTLSLTEGQAYKFDQSDSSNSSHPLRISTTSNGTHSGGSEYTTGVTTSGTPGSSGAYTQIEVAVGAPTLYYYCTNHSGMGGQLNT
tara:strand:+ start:724 stop:1443 length:720 start_codon:yes stop_codon:yes gene_type:complete